MMLLLFCCNLGEGADFVNNTAPFQGSNFIPTPTSLALSQSGPAVPSHQEREEAHPLQSQADFKKRIKHVLLISSQ